MVDGRVARRTNQVTVFGAFFDSVIDRYSDVVLFFGLLVYYARINHFRYVVLTAFVMVTSLMVSYTRARAEALIGQCKVGFMERPERIVLVILGALFNHWGVMAPVLWVLAVLSTITVVHRIQYTYWNTKHLAPTEPYRPAASFPAAVHHHHRAACLGRLPLHQESASPPRTPCGAWLELSAALAVEQLAFVRQHGQRRHPQRYRNSVLLGDIQVLVHASNIDVDEDEVGFEDGPVLGVMKVNSPAPGSRRTSFRRSPR